MKKIFSSFYTVLCFIFLYAPIAILVVFSFNSDKGFKWMGFSTKWYVELFKNEEIINALMNTLIVAVVASVFLQ